MKIKKEDLSLKILTAFNELIPEKYLTDGVVIKPNDAEYAFEDKDKPTY